jgi:hypothetical protein
MLGVAGCMTTTSLHGRADRPPGLVDLSGLSAHANLYRVTYLGLAQRASTVAFVVMGCASLPQVDDTMRDRLIHIRMVERLYLYHHADHEQRRRLVHDAIAGILRREAIDSVVVEPTSPMHQAIPLHLMRGDPNVIFQTILDAAP